MSAYPILYSFRRCPYAMRARMALLVSGQACELREVVLARKPTEMLAASAKGTVPVLQLPDGRVIDESLDVMRWALAQHDPEGWLPLSAGAGELIAANDGAFKHHLDRYKYPNRHDSDPIVHRAAGLAILTEWDRRIGVAGQLCGARRSLADIAIFPFVRQFAETDRAWFDVQALPALQPWLAGHLQTALFQQAMIRVPPWRAEDGEGPLLGPTPQTKL